MPGSGTRPSGIDYPTWAALTDRHSLHRSPDTVWNLYCASREPIPKRCFIFRQGKLFDEEALSLGKAAKLAGLSIAEFTEHLSHLDIPVVDYPATELDDELKYFLP